MDTTLTTGTDEAAVEALAQAMRFGAYDHHPACCGACDECLRICGGYHGPERRTEGRDPTTILAALRAQPAAARAIRDAIDPDGLRTALELTRGVLGMEPTDEEVREYRLDARDPENRRLNYAEWRSHRLLEGTPDAD